MNSISSKSFLRICGGVALSILVMFGLFRITAVFFRTLLYDDQSGELNYSLLYLILSFIYPLVCNFVYISGLCENSIVPKQKKYLWLDDMKIYINNEGKFLFIVYAILAIIFEISYLVSGDGMNVITQLLIYCFPLSEIVKVPVIRTIIGYVFTMFFITFFTLLSRKKHHKTWS